MFYKVIVIVSSLSSECLVSTFFAQLLCPPYACAIMVGLEVGKEKKGKIFSSDEE